MEPKLDEHEREQHRQWEKEVACYKPGIRAIFRRAGLPEDVIDDLTQETLLKAYRNRGRVILSIWRWLDRIASNTLIDFLKARERRLECSLHHFEDEDADIPAEHGEDPEEAVMQDALRESVRAALQQINPNERALLDLYYFSNQSIKEIACAHNRRPGAIKMALSRARRSLEQKLYQTDPEFLGRNLKEKQA